MATARGVDADTESGTVTIEELTIENQEIANFLGKFSQEEHVDVLEQTIRIGTATLELSETSKDVEFVKREFEQIKSELEDEIEEIQEEVEDKFGDEGVVPDVLENHLGDDGTLQEHIDGVFGEDGQLKERLDEELGEDGERIQNALDPDNEGSPTYRLEQRLKNEITSVREKIVEAETESDIRSRTYLKGGDFEDTIHQILEEIVRQTPNNVEFTGNTTGEMGRDVGDFVVSLADTDQNIVVEAKTESYSTQNIKDEMEEALQNRDAPYGLFVTDSLDNLPRTKTGWFHEFPEQNAVVVAMSETSEEDIEPGYLRIAFNWARMRAVQEYAEIGRGFDPEELQSELTEIEESIGRFQTIRGQCTEISNSRERIEETLREIEEDVTKRLVAIEAELTETGNG